ncbi:hypothetical protein ACRALDRAFT_1070512 [Sodiomyces alcalophilus JCM 7366]|uniref:uncharacterized protein n=1 Tax=Sodiomyces alcalophilus JCM 7366 TaxID=591952 RepID=UPI0039B5D103
MENITRDNGIFSTKDNEVLEFQNLSIVSSYTLEVLTNDQRRKVQSLMNSILGVLKKLIITLKNNSRIYRGLEDKLELHQSNYNQIDESGKGLNPYAKSFIQAIKAGLNKLEKYIPRRISSSNYRVFRPYIFSVILDPQFNYSFLFRDANIDTFDLFAFKQQIYENLEEEYNTL